MEYLMDGQEQYGAMVILKLDGTMITSFMGME